MKLARIFLTITWCILPWEGGQVSGGAFKELSHQEHDPKELEKLMTEGMSGDNVEGALTDRLFLTPLILRGSFDKARSLALVDSEFSPVRSYSGFLTVNTTFNTNLFFWFFPAAFDAEQAPVLLWLNGGPGASSLFGLFAENGPYYVDSKGYLNLRTSSWALTHSVIYIDNPAGCGFSFTEDEDGFPKSLDQVSADLYSALSQFFVLFPKFQEQDLYLTGQSYAAKYLTTLAVKINEENAGAPLVKMNLKGLVLSAPYLDPSVQADYGSFLYSVGLVDERAKEHFDMERARFEELAKANEWGKAHTLMDELIHGDLTIYPTYFQNVTSFRANLNYLQPVYPPSYSTHRAFLRQPFVRTAAHAGTQKYHSFSKKVMRGLRNDVHKSGKAVLESVLQLNYKVLIISGQLDLICHTMGITKLVNSLDWSGKEDFARANRTVWRVNSDHAGFLRVAKNLAFLTMRNAGHSIPFDKPLWAYTLINEFTSGFLFETDNE